MPKSKRTGLPLDQPSPGDLNVTLPVRNTNATTGVDTVLETAADGSQTLKTRGGIVLIESRPARAWVKLRGEPALTLYESPEEFMAAWLKKEREDLDYLVCHDFTFGRPMFFLRGVELGFVGITFPTTLPQNVGAGSIYSRSCECWRFGGACPRPDA